MYLQNLHTHSIYCDGKDTLEEMCERAVELGFDSIGFSRHGSMPYKTPYVKEELRSEYLQTAEKLKEKYKDKLDVFTGVELDVFHDDDESLYEYIITSAHYINIDGELVGFDRTAEQVKSVVDTYFGGDGLAFVKKAYSESMKIGDTRTNIVGHFDLVTKHAETTGIFDENSPEYKRLALEAVHTIAEKVRVFELNTGCVSRGYRKTPYLAPFIIKELKALDCQICITSDCHNKNYFDESYDTARQTLISCGYKNIAVFTKEGFKEAAII